jgi:chemotaxis protein MotA
MDAKGRGDMRLLEAILPPIRQNLLGYDMIIMVAAAGTLAYFIFMRRYASYVYNAIYTKGYRPDDIEGAAAAPLSAEETKALRGRLRVMRETTEKYYAMFINLIGIFPLLGILGTVVALLPMVQDTGNMQQNFYVALTSTLWGLVFSIIFKLLDGTLYPRIERNNRGIEDFMRKLEHK